MSQIIRNVPQKMKRWLPLGRSFERPYKIRVISVLRSESSPMIKIMGYYLTPLPIVILNLFQDPAALLLLLLFLAAWYFSLDTISPIPPSLRSCGAGSPQPAPDHPPSTAPDTPRWPPPPHSTPRCASLLPKTQTLNPKPSVLKY